jgi:hypothetical protein
VNGLFWGMSEWLSPLWWMLAIGAIASGGIVYAMTRASGHVWTDGAKRDSQVPEIVVIEPREWRNHSPLE